jgi:carboxy-cis,cis-muconate cyclase
LVKFGSFKLINIGITGYSNSGYLSDEVALSYSRRYLWATSRGSNANSTGFISAFNLVSSGAIETQLFLAPTTTGGGKSNSVAPSDFTDEFVALSDNAKGFVQIWRFNGTWAEVVATVDIADSTCCSNTIWYD